MKEIREKIGEELWKQLTDKLGVDPDKWNWVPFQRISEVQDELKQAKDELENVRGEFGAEKQKAIEEAISEYKGQIADLTKKMKKFEGLEGTSEELKKQLQDARESADTKVKELTELQEKQAQDYEKQLAVTKKNLKLENEVIKAGAKNPKAVLALLDQEKIQLDGDRLLGLEDQLNGLKEKESYLFGTTKVKSAGAETEKGEPSLGDNWSLDDVDKWDDSQIQANMDKILDKMQGKQ